MITFDVSLFSNRLPYASRGNQTLMSLYSLASFTCQYTKRIPTYESGGYSCTVYDNSLNEADSGGLGSILSEYY